MLEICEYDTTIISAPVLENASINWLLAYFGGGAIANCSVVDLFKAMPRILNLDLGCSTLQILGGGHVPQRLPVDNDYLSEMNLEINFGDAKQVLVTLCLLKSSPNLQKLGFLSYCDGEQAFGQVLREAEEDAGLFSKPETVTDAGLFGKLETVTMDGMMCIEAELEFIESVLTKAQMLKKIVISLDSRHVKDKETVAELMESCMVSSQAQILLT